MGSVCFLIVVLPSSASGEARSGDRLFPVSNGKKFGYVNSLNQLRISYRFTSAGNFINGLAIVHKKQYSAAIDTNGRIVIPFRKQNIVSYPGGYWIAYEKYNLSHVYSRGKCIYSGPANFELASVNRIYSRKLRALILNEAKVSENGFESYLINEQGKTILKYKDNRAHKLSFLLAPERHDSDLLASRCFVLERTNKAGRIYSLLNPVAKAIIDSIIEITCLEDRIIIRREKDAAVLGLDLNYLVPFQALYQSIEKLPCCHFYLVQKGGYYGILDSSMRVAIEPLYSSCISYLGSGFFKSTEPDGTNLYLNVQGDLVLSCREDLSAWQLQGPCALTVPVDQLTAAMRMITYEYEYRLWKRGRYISARYKYLQGVFGPERYTIFLDNSGKSGILDSNGNVLVSGNYFGVSAPSNGMLCAQTLLRSDSGGVQDKHQSFFVNLDGTVGDNCFDHIWPFNANWTSSVREDRYFNISRDGKVFPLHYEMASIFQDGVMLVRSQGKYALADSSGALLSTWFDDLHTTALSRNQLEVLQNSTYVQRDSIRLIKPVFNDSVMIVYKSSKAGLLHQSGQFRIYPLYRDVVPVVINQELKYYRLIWEEGKSRFEGLCDASGKIILYPEYRSIRYDSDGDYFIVEEHSNRNQKIFLAEN